MAGAKNDEGKLRYDLVPPDALEEVVRVYTHGAHKYGDQNYRAGLNWSRVYAAMLRHLEAWRKGEEVDPEGFLHLAAVAWGSLTLMEYAKIRQDLDDRPVWWDEQWLPVPEATTYEVSNKGRVRKHYASSTVERYGYTSPRLLLPTIDDKGYQVLQCWGNGCRKKLYVHRLVATLFLRPPEPEEVVNHRNADKADNRVENLEWVDTSGNALATYRSGRRPRCKPGDVDQRFGKRMEYERLGLGIAKDGTGQDATKELEAPPKGY